MRRVNNIISHLIGVSLADTNDSLLTSNNTAAGESGSSHSSSSSSNKLEPVFIVGAARTPMGSFMGALSSIPAPQLASVAISAALLRANIPSSAVQELLAGNVLSANIGQAPARQAALASGLPTSTCCTTINKVCASGMKAITLGYQSIVLKQAEIVVSAGMENMSLTPHYLSSVRGGNKLGDVSAVDGLSKDGLYDPHFKGAMGIAGEACAKKFQITREEQDQYALESYKRATNAHSQGFFKHEISPVNLSSFSSSKSTAKSASLFAVDQEFSQLKAEKVSSLPTVFEKKNGTITAANASKLSDGASAVVLCSQAMIDKYQCKPLARIVAYADAEVPPIQFPESPSVAIALALQRAGLTVNDIGFWEINEAFSAVALANIKLLQLDPAKVNVYGGAVALGHPLGSSGCRIVVTLLSVLKQNNAKYGVAAICNGGGGGTAIIVENLAFN